MTNSEREHDVESLAMTMWGYHPALWLSCTTRRERQHFIRRARSIFNDIDAYRARVKRRS